MKTASIASIVARLSRTVTASSKPQTGAHLLKSFGQITLIVLLIGACGRKQEPPKVEAPPPIQTNIAKAETPKETPPLPVSPELAWRNYVNATPALLQTERRIAELKQQEETMTAVVKKWREEMLRLGKNPEAYDGSSKGTKLVKTGRYDYSKVETRERDLRPPEVAKAQDLLPKVSSARQSLEKDFANAHNQFLASLNAARNKQTQ